MVRLIAFGFVIAWMAIGEVPLRGLSQTKEATPATDPAKAIEELREQLKLSGQLLKDSKWGECSTTIESATQGFVEILRTAPSKHWPELKKIHAQLVKAQQLLEVQGAELTALADWDDLEKGDPKNPKTGKDPKPSTKPNPRSKPNERKPNEPKPNEPKPSGTVSFTKEIAPWMVEQCARCHIAAARGGFSLESYAALMKGSKGGVVLFPGDAAGSRLVETIEIGDMPRGGAKVSPENLAKLKQWITEGAKFDGPAPTDPIASLVKPTDSAKPAPEPTVIKSATGKETVSFARDIAPILTENCNGCHFRGQRASGGLRFDNFAQLIKGGDSGALIVPGKPDDSLLIKKLRGMSGQRMPAGGRPPLSDQQIQSVSTWIKEGASFDGSGKETRLDQVASQAWASKATHAELMAKRMQRARDQWKIVAPKTPADEAHDDEYHVIGNIGPESAKQLLAQVNTAAGQVRKMFKLSGREPLIKGGITIYALKQRYDYSEFGTMLESRSLPTDWNSHWRREVLDCYVSMVFEKSDAKVNEPHLIQHLTSLWIASHDGVPQWFADGAGRQAFAVTVGNNDPRVQPWLRRLPESMTQLKNLKPFLDGSMNEEDSATIGYGIIRFMFENNLRRQYDAVVRSLDSGMKFDKAFEKSFGPPEVFLQRLLGKAK